MTTESDLLYDHESNLSFNNIIDGLEFPCNQPEIINGAYEGSNYLLVQCTDLPDLLRIYVNTGEYGLVKDEFCLIKLNEPLKTGSDIWVYVESDLCNVESCKFTIGDYIAANETCTYIADNPISGTLTGSMICLGQDLHREIYDQYGNKTVGTLVQEDCIYCGGTLPSCE